MVQVINTKNRLYNGVKKWGIIDIPEDKVFEYKIAWFSVVENKQNIVKTPTAPKTLEWIDEAWTVAQLKEKLEHLGVDYKECKTKLDFQKLLSEALKTPTVPKTDDVWEKKDIEALRTQLIDEKIVEASELEWKSEAEIMQIATDNWLI